jgi:hypothetical protein
MHLMPGVGTMNPGQCRCGSRRLRKIVLEVQRFAAKTQPRWETASKLVSSREGCPMKGNINTKGERIYHAPWSKLYAKTE